MHATRVALFAAIAIFPQAIRGDDTKLPTAARMAVAADKFIAALTEEQRGRVQYAFDSPERLNWHYIPLQDKDGKATRKGVPLEDLKPAQHAAALELLRAGTSPSGFAKASAIMAYEALIGEQEKGGPNVRRPGWYFITIFGQPGSTGDWGWRWEGHHLALNVTVKNGAIAAASPAFFGVNPVRLQDGPHKGKRTLPDEEDFAKQLFDSLDAKQKATAQPEKPFPEIEGRTPALKTAGPRGLAAAGMTAEQRATLEKLIRSYLNRQPDAVAEAEWAAIAAAGVDRVHFAFSGGTAIGQQHTYRVEGPTFQIQYLCNQNDSIKTPANHIHSVYRSAKGDFGGGR